ncbi:hypothetical protein FEF33_03855 [Moraxella osloensis]|nr:hypothetical protein FEF33_03855 [Moraxella osloensis]
MTPIFEIEQVLDNTHLSTPHYLFKGYLSDDDFEFQAFQSLTDFVIGKDKVKVPYLIQSQHDRPSEFDEKTDEYFTGKKSSVYPSKIVFVDKTLAMLREQAKQSFIVTAQRKLFEKHKFDYLDVLSLVLDEDIDHCKDHFKATAEVSRIIQKGLEAGYFSEEFNDPELEYQVVSYNKKHIRLNDAQLIIECDTKNNYFLINVVCNSLNIHIDARIAISRYLQTIGESAKYFDENKRIMMTATAGVYDKFVIIKNHDKGRFISKNEVNLTTMLKDGTDPNSDMGDGIHVFPSYQDAWLYAFKYAPNTDILVGYVKTS